LKKRGSCGREFPGCDVKLVAEDGITEVGPNEPGELITRNPGLAKGYWKLPEITAQRFRDGWLYTGDLLRKDKDGYFYFVGRRDDVIDVGGERVYPKEVEDILLRHANIRDVCVVPAPHPVKGKAPVAFVAERAPGETSEQELQTFFLSQGSAFAHPRRVIFLEKLPLNSTGKFDRNKMRDMASQITLEPQGAPSGRR
jgi:acyl-coenzyme A synthetase/AMP-(fatty) acid ligase